MRTTRYAARRGIRQYRDGISAVVAKTLQGNGRFGHLHQGQHALFHARSARCRAHDDRQLTLARTFEQTREALADDGAHRAAAEVEVHHAERHRNLADRSEAAHDAFGEFRFSSDRVRASADTTSCRSRPAGRRASPRRRFPRTPRRRASRCDRTRACGSDALHVVQTNRFFARSGTIEHRRAFRTLRPLCCVLERLLRSAPDLQPLGNHGRPKNRPR